MGIWIRSQDGNMIIKAIGARIYNCIIWAAGIEEEIESRLGDYASEAEAQAVLDQIQGHINKCCKTVFQMPEAGFSQEFIPECGADLNHCGLLDGKEDHLRYDPNTRETVPRCSGYADCMAAWDRGCR